MLRQRYLHCVTSWRQICFSRVNVREGGSPPRQLTWIVNGSSCEYVLQALDEGW